MKQKSIFFLLTLCFTSILSFGQAVVSTENFDAVTFPPSGWAVKPVLTTSIWSRKTTPWTNPTATPHSGVALARFASRNAAAGSVQSLVTRPIDYTNRGTNAANMDFWMYRDSLIATNLDSLTIWVNSADSLNTSAVKLGTIARNRSVAIPDTQAVNGWYHFIYAIPASFTGTTTHFIFQGTSQTAIVNQGIHIYIDDVSFDEYPAICTGTPNVGNIVATTPLLCGGTGSSELHLTAPIIGLSGITYTWQKGTSVTGPWVTIGTNQPTSNTGTITGTTYYQCLVNCSFSGFSYTTPVDSVVVSSNTPPVVSTTPTSAVYCIGTSGVQIVASGALTYTWTPALGLNNTTGDTVYASPATSTQFIVKGTDAVGCWDTASVNIAFNAGPTVNITANPNDTVCVGNQVILTSTPVGVTGNIYLWSDGKITRRDTITVSANITLSVMITNAGGCSLSDTITIVANPPAAANFGHTNTGNSYHFTDSSSSATTWTWTFGDGNGSSNQNPTYTYSTAGTYTVTLVISGPCNNDTMSQVIVVGPEGVDNINTSSSVNFYPNPVHDVLNLELANQIINRISIKNYLGQTILTAVNSNNNKSIAVPTSSLTPGMYVAEVISNGHLHSFKFSKE